MGSNENHELEDMKIVHRLNLDGDVCPIPAAKSRKLLRKINSGETFKITGDFEEAVPNIIKMVEKNGGKIISVESHENFYKIIGKKL
ncbi:MAG: sulfurtransferase TusA family protein [Promethearchaeota archaeon]